MAVGGFTGAHGRAQKGQWVSYHFPPFSQWLPFVVPLVRIMSADRLDATAVVLGKVASRIWQQVEAQRLHQRQAEAGYDQTRREVDELNRQQRDVHHLCVGGVSFHTHGEVLRKCEGSMLSVVASDDVPFSTVDADGYTSFDRDPVWFPLVLVYLREGVTALPDSYEERDAIFDEADYYAVKGLCQAAKERRCIAVVGGSEETSCMDVYDSNQRLWKASQPGLTTNRESFASCVAEDGFFVCGGKTFDKIFLLSGVVNRYTSSNGQWSTVSLLPEAVHTSSASSLRGQDNITEEQDCKEDLV